MDYDQISRRLFVLRSTAAALAPFLSRFDAIALRSAHAAAGAPTKLVFLSSEQMAALEAVTDRIVPAVDGLPGARDAHAAAFIDQALTTFFKDDQRGYTEGLTLLEKKSKELYPASSNFASLSTSNQDAVLEALSQTPFASMVRAHTIVGCFSDPKYGGNFDHKGWTLLGFDHRPAYQPPFGYYDRDQHTRAQTSPTSAASSGARARNAPDVVQQDAGRAPVRYAPNTEVDFVVVGAGAAGGAVAWELVRAGMRVVVLEQGPYLTEKDFNHDELAIFELHALTNDPKRQPQTFRKNPDEEAKPGLPAFYGRAVGGGSLHFTTNYWRFREIDFKERSAIGAISGTGFADWPISYADLEPYYTRAERVLGISGLAGANPMEPPRSAPYPLPPLPVKSSGVLFERAARKLGWHPFPAPMAVLSQPYRGRAACQHCGFCQFFGCEYGAKSSSLVSVIREAEATGRCEIRPNSYARKIELDARGRATGVVYFDRDGKEQVQRAKAVVVSANGAETPRLLLMSKSNVFPNGLANSSGMVGKHLMFNGNGGTTGVFEHELNEWKSVQVTRVLWDFYDFDDKRGFYGGGGLDARFGAISPITAAFSSVFPKDKQWGADFARKLHNNFSRRMDVITHSTSLPVPTNAIDLDPKLKDEWGLPALRLTYRDHPDDLKMVGFLQKRALELLAAADAIDSVEFPVGEQQGGVHLLGTCRMGDDPRTSVIDRNHRTHDVKNLFLADGSSFVTSGRGQPTCTIQALAFRAGELMARAAKRGEV
jgi:choline dehydrogenase-like flavoprotein